jgi:hypothetical protein
MYPSLSLQQEKHRSSTPSPKHLGPELFQITDYFWGLECLHIHNEISWEWDPNQHETRSFPTLLTHLHNLKVALCNSFNAPVYSMTSHMRSVVGFPTFGFISALKSFRFGGTLDFGFSN